MKFATILMSVLFAGMVAHAQGETAPAAAGSDAPKAESTVKKEKKHKKHSKKDKSADKAAAEGSATK